MLTKVEARNNRGSLLTIQFDDVTDGFVLKSIDGLDPVKATLVSSNFATLDGAQFQSSRRETRNIIMTVGLEPDYITDSVRTLRLRLYEYFMPKSEVNLRFYDDDGLQVEIVGRVETCETPLFSKEPEISISIICYDPDFKELTEETYSGNTVSDTTDVLFEYAGSVETGIIFTLNVDRTLTEFTIYHTAPDSSVSTFDVAASLVADDILIISTVPGDKYITLNRGGTLTSLLYAKAPQSKWVQLDPGDNYIRVYATGASIPYTISYLTRHGGL